MDKLEFKIENVGGCRRLAVSLYPGVVVLRGANGVGKSSAIRAIARASGADVALEPRDGSPGGLVEGPGVSLRVRKHVGATGKPAAEAADIGPLADLIDPGLKDPEAAARARLRALLLLVPLASDRGTIAELAGGDQAIEHAALTSDKRLDTALDVAEAVRTAAHRLAREAEQMAAAAGGEASALDVAIAAKGVSEPAVASDAGDPEEMRAIVQDAARELDVAREGARRRKEAEARLDEARAAGGERPDLDSAVDAWSTSAKAVDAGENELRRLRDMVTTQEEQLRGLRQRNQDRREEVDACEVALKRWEAQQEVLSRPIDGPTEGDVEAAERLYLETSSDLALARGRAEVRELRSRRDELAGRRDRAAGRAVWLRDTAKAVSQRLAELLSRSGLEGLAVVDGRLVVDVGGEQRDFADRLSDGERIAAALRVAAVAYPGRVVPLDGRFWAALDGRRQQEFAAAAETAGLFCITESPADVEGIQAQHVGAAVGAAS